MHARALGVAHPPTADEEVEGEVVNPAREQRAWVLEELRDARERIEVARRPPEGRHDEPEIDEREQERNQHGTDEPRRPFPARHEDKQQPARQNEHAAYREELFGGQVRLASFSAVENAISKAE